MKHKKKSKVVVILSAVLLIGAVAGAMFLGAGVGKGRVTTGKISISTNAEGKVVSMKGLELYVWKNKKLPSDDKTYFTLLEGTNRQKFESEVYNFAMAKTSIDEINEELSSYNEDGFHLSINQINEEDFTKVEMMQIQDSIVIKSVNYSKSIGLAELLPDNYTVENFINDLGYEIVVNSGANIEIQLPQNFEIIVDDTDFKVGEFFKERNEKSNKLFGKDFSKYLGQRVKVYTYGIEKDGASKGELISLVNNSGIIGAWIDDTRVIARHSKYGSDDFTRIRLNLVDVKSEKTETGAKGGPKQLPTMYVNANNKGYGVSGLSMHFMLSSATHENVEKNILKVNKGNIISLDFEDKPKLLSLKTTGIYGNGEKGLKVGEYIEGKNIQVPDEPGQYFYQAEVEFETGKFFYPFKFEVTLENQMIKKLEDIEFEKITKLGIIEREWIEKKGFVQEKPERFLYIDKNKANVEIFINLVSNAGINENIALDRIPSDYKIRIYFNDGTWMNSYYWSNSKEYNFNIDNVRGEITIKNINAFDKMVLGRAEVK